MAVQASRNLSIQQFVLDGQPETSYPETVLQDAARAIPLAKYTVMHQIPSTRKWQPFISVNPTSATLLCAAFGTNLAGIQAILDGEFRIPIDGVNVDITGLDFSGITALSDIPGVINTQLSEYSVVATWDDNDTTILFTHLEEGAGHSIGVLATVAGGGGTDISVAGYLNGAAGTVTLGTSQTPDGFYMGAGLTVAEMVAGDVTLQPIMNAGKNCNINESAIVFDGGTLTLNSILSEYGMTVRQYLIKNGFVPTTTYADSAYEN